MVFKQDYVQNRTSVTSTTKNNCRASLSNMSLWIIQWRFNVYSKFWVCWVNRILLSEVTLKSRIYGWDSCIYLLTLGKLWAQQHRPNAIRYIEHTKTHQTQIGKIISQYFTAFRWNLSVPGITYYPRCSVKQKKKTWNNAESDANTHTNYCLLKGSCLLNYIKSATPAWCAIVKVHHHFVQS